MYMWLRAKELPFTKGEFKHWCKTDFIFTLGFDQLGQNRPTAGEPLNGLLWYPCGPKDLTQGNSYVTHSGSI